MEPEDSPRKSYRMKPREFQRVNAAPGSVAKPGVASGAHPAPVDPNDVHSILQQNRAVERRDGHHEVVIKTKKSKRKRDYWMLLVGGNLLTVALVALGPLNPISLVFGLAGLVIISLGTTWIMWFVMDDY